MEAAFNVLQVAKARNGSSSPFISGYCLITLQPMPLWNPITGHLLCLVPHMSRFPKDAMQTYLIGELTKDFANTDYLVYLDLWPFSLPMIVITNPDLAIQACQQHDLIKPAVLKSFFNPFAGGDNLFTMNGSEYVHFLSCCIVIFIRSERE
jgi:hypothetical protein